MQILDAALTFDGVWLLYIFSLNQGVIEILEQTRIVNKFNGVTDQYPAVSPWYWLLPPLKIKREKERAVQILRDQLHGQEELHELFNFLNKATAWLYIALAGILNGVVATDALVGLILRHHQLLVIIIVDVLMLTIGPLIVRFRLNPQREQVIAYRIFKRTRKS